MIDEQQWKRGRWWVTFPTDEEGEINDDGPNYEEIRRCLDRWTMTGLEIEIYLMNGRTETEEIQLFPANFRPMQDQLAIAHVVTFTTMQRRINFT